MSITSGHLAGIIVTLTGVTLVGLYAGRRVKSARDFQIGSRRASTAVVAGAIMGTLVGGSSTIGTAQMAFKYGLCAWWFTLGSGIGCALLCLMARRVREVPLHTVPQYLGFSFVKSTGLVACVVAFICSGLGVVAQGLSGVALLSAMFGITSLAAAGLCVLLVLGFVIFGGVWGTGLVGVLKSSLLYLAVVGSGALAYYLAGGQAGLVAVFPSFPWFSFFGRSFNQDFAMGLSMLAGVLSSQYYIQAIYAGKSLADARRGALLSAVLVPPVGLGGVLVGLYMRANFPGISPDQALPQFILGHLPPFLAGVALAALLITVICTWSGIVLGISTILTRDIYKQYIRPGVGDSGMLLMQRLIILLVCLLSVPLITTSAGTLIMGWVTLSMVLQSCATLLPLLAALYLPRLVTPAAATLSALLGPLAVAVWHLLFPDGLSPLYPGFLVSLLVIILVSLVDRRGQDARGQLMDTTR
ncbi:MAG TPA: sodium:solute symporter family protein [Bacillota bacterium]|jgi:SSS family solute:Na+ symporter|nr:sodium:solute symporter family protein [Peptococcaceae bacterium MAG4]HPU35256.1 sodium:solute symporter family protein [Bacillota bacterium]HPZ43964.1 sodium:solute symporter family protein [Bacillota bacterium]HUM59150.1 sodium:solute symporter family protein [Bacillota bacterium]